MYSIWAELISDAGCLDCKPLLWSILNSRKDVAQLRKLRRCVNLSRRSYVPAAGKTDVCYIG